MFTRVQPNEGDVNGGETIKRGVAIAEIEIIGIRLRRIFIASPLNQVKALLLGQIERTQDHGIHHTENHGVCTDGHGQRQHRDRGEAPAIPQHTQCVS